MKSSSWLLRLSTVTSYPLRNDVWLVERTEDVEPVSVPHPNCHASLAQAIDGPFAYGHFRDEVLSREIFQEALDALIPLGWHAPKRAELVDCRALAACVQFEKFAKDPKNDIFIGPITASPCPPPMHPGHRGQSVQMSGLSR